MTQRTKPKVPATVKMNGPNPEMRVVPYDLCQATIQMLLQVPVAHGYILTKRWEEVCPELFQAQEAPA